MVRGWRPQKPPSKGNPKNEGGKDTTDQAKEESQEDCGEGAWVAMVRTGNPEPVSGDTQPKKLYRFKNPGKTNHHQLEHQLLHHTSLFCNDQFLDILEYESG